MTPSPAQDHSRTEGLRESPLGLTKITATPYSASDLEGLAALLDSSIRTGHDMVSCLNGNSVSRLIAQCYRALLTPLQGGEDCLQVPAVRRGSASADYSVTDQQRSGGEVPPYVREALRGLTRAQKRHVMAGCLSGDFTMATVRNLQRKALFYLHIDSPNGRCGTLRLTPLGETVRGILRARAAIAKATGGAA